MNGVFSQEGKTSCFHIGDVDVGSHITGVCIRVKKKKKSLESPFSVNMNCVNKAASAEKRESSACPTAPGGYFWLTRHLKHPGSPQWEM